ALLRVQRESGVAGYFGTGDNLSYYVLDEEQLQAASTHVKSKYVQLACMVVLAAGALAIRGVPLLATSAEYASLSSRNLYAINQSSKNRGSISIYDIDAGHRLIKTIHTVPDALITRIESLTCQKPVREPRDPQARTDYLEVCGSPQR